MIYEFMINKEGDFLIENYKTAICSRETINFSLCIYYCGSKVCLPGESWGQKYTDHYILCYIFEGKGTLTVEGKVYEINKNQGFVITPKTKVTFQSDYESPCQYAWIGFYGFLSDCYLKRAGLTAETPLFTSKDDIIANCFLNIIEYSKLEHNRYCRIMASLYMIFSHFLDRFDEYEVVSTKDPNEGYLRKTLEYIDMNYGEKLSIKEISDYVGIDRKYLHFIFNKKLDISPQQYLIKYRVQKACALLKDNNLSISEVSKIVGYKDPLHFSKMFKKFIGISPKEYKKNPISYGDNAIFRQVDDIELAFINEKK